MRESVVQNIVRLAMSKITGLTHWRNNTGQAWTGNKTVRSGNKLIIEDPRPVNFGLCPGSSDLIGIKTVTITPDMVGQKIGIFVAAEIKTKTGRVSKQQKTFVDHINNAGGIAIIARSEDDLEPLR